jgi:membrane fusion protein, macrolide-specific efflux system
VTGTAPDLFGMPAPAPEPAIGNPPRGRRARLRHATTRSRPRRQWAYLGGGVVIVALVAAGGGYWALRGSPASTPTTELVAAASSTLGQTVSSTGTIEPAQQANLNFATSGQLTSVAVKVGQRVTTGQVLATVNSASLAASVAQAEATESSDAAKLSSDQASGSATTAQLTADQDSVTAAENQVTDAEQALAEAKLTSPINGVVAALNLTVGQQVSGNGSSASGSGSGGSGAASTGTGSASAPSTGSSSPGSTSSSDAQVVVISTGSYVVDGTVDDTQIGLVQNGDQAVITPGGATTPVYGTISSVGLIATTTSGVATYPVTIAVTGNPGGLYPGASASLTLIVKQLSDVTTVPTGAVHYTASGAAEVYEIVNGRQVDDPVTVGMTSDGRTQIVSGLSVGTEVVAPTERAGGTGATTGGTTGRTGRGLGGGGGGFGGGGGGFGGGGLGGS